MERPTKERVDEAMRHRWAGVAADEAVPVLQAEVRWLRGEVESHARWADGMVSKWGADAVAVFAALARIESLLARWKANDELEPGRWTRAALELELAVKGVEV